MRSRFAVEVEECDRTLPLPRTQARSLPLILSLKIRIMADVGKQTLG
ncbi:hypothetical protein NDI44_09840 [Trichocoleus sp. DQ-A3]|nr:hypothetical protein [Coleofasciculus sp. FACHB-125]MBD1903056.1 hypothetical protein [Coleofasciculus sp. FACHB-125]